MGRHPPSPASSGEGEQPGKPFDKPWRSWSDQIRLLESRGMIIADRSSAEAFLSHVNYYRFSGYVLAFERSRHAFVPGTTFEQVRDAYEFDRVLRDLVTESLELVEVDARTAIGYHFGRSYGAFGHTEPANFFATFRHRDWIDKLNAEATRSNEQFVRHYRRTYSGFPDLPAWIATEVMSFGAISIMFRGMRRDDQREIARRYRIQPGFLASWLHHLVYVRNVCAHHSRVWDRVWAIKPDLPPLPAWSSPLLPGNDRLFVTLLILRRLLARCPSIAPFDAAWKSRVERHLSVPPDVADPLIRMGLHRDWKSHPLWA